MIVFECLQSVAPNWVVCAPLALPLSSEVLDCLSAAERERCARFRQADDRQRYQIAHVLKRLLLAQLLGVKPEQLSFGVGDKGKPYCQHPDAPFFNLSHGGDWVVLAVCADAEVGVDVECRMRKLDAAVHQRVLSAAQYQQLQQSPRPEECFMVYWTQKEAISKAIGLGLSIGFQHLQCSGVFGESAASYEQQELYLSSHPLSSDYIVSHAAELKLRPTFYALGTDWQLRVIRHD